METNLVFSHTQQKTSAASFLWQMIRNPLDALTDLSREQGDIAHIRIGKREIFLLTHPEFIEQALVKQGHNFIKGPALQRARVLLGEGLLTSEGEAHLAQRRALQPAFHPQCVDAYVSLMTECAQNHLAAWEKGQRAGRRMPRHRHVDGHGLCVGQDAARAVGHGERPRLSGGDRGPTKRSR